MAFLTSSDGIQLHYEVHGSGAKEVVLLHGMGGSSATWQLVISHLALREFRILALDLRGHGRSGGGGAHFNFPQLTADILAAADAAGLHQALVVGFSGACKNVVQLALSAPTRVRGVMLIGPAGMGEVPLPRDVLRGVFDYIGREGSFPAEFAPWFTEKIGSHRRTVEAGYARTPRAALDASAELWVHTSISEQALKVTHPVLVIAGEREPLYHPEFQRQTTLVSLPHARMEILDCGHFMTFEEPAAVAEAITRFSAALPQPQ